ncbi:MAG: MFS transporter [Myxococcota bacterium]
MNRSPSLPYLAAVSAASLAVAGAVVPYMALELRTRGLSGAPMILAMAALPTGRLLAGPLWSVLADLTRAQRWLLRIAAVLAIIGLSLVPQVGRFWAPLAVLLYSVGRAPMTPLLDALTLNALDGDRGRYGRIRRWGSAGFLLSSLLVPVLVQQLGLEQLTPGFFLCVLVLMMVWWLPEGSPPPKLPLGPALRALGRDGPMRWILAAAALHFSAHVGTNSHLAVHMRSLDAPDTLVGVALALGVAVEIGVMSAGKWWLETFRPDRLFLIAIAAAIARWALASVATEGWHLVLIQLSHGFTFGAFWIAAVSLVSERAAPAVATSAQGMLAAAVGGVGALIGMAGASTIADIADTRAIFVCAIFLAVGATLCALNVQR